MSGGTTGTPVVVGDQLVTLDEIKEHLAIEDVQTTNDEVIEDRIPAVCKAVEAHCGRRFQLFEDETRTIWPNAKGSLYVIDLLDTPAPTVYIDSALDRQFSTLVSADDYEFLPYPEDTFETARYQEIAYFDGQAFDSWCPARVTGSFGWVEDDGRAPHAVRLAICMMFAKWWKRRETPAVVMQMPGFGFKRMLEQDTDIQDILEPYVHQRRRRRPVR